jgi:hypothetical protein
MTDNTIEYTADFRQDFTGRSICEATQEVHVPEGRYRVTLTRIEEPLRECPHCGGKAEIVEEHGTWAVRCKVCRSSTVWVEAETVRARPREYVTMQWNRRTP